MNVNCRSGWRQQNVNTDTNGSNRLNGEGETQKRMMLEPVPYALARVGSIASNWFDS
jgi:hypothetical protein